MAKISINEKTGERRLTLTWRSNRFSIQERILSDMRGSGDMREYIMKAILIAEAAAQSGFLPDTASAHGLPKNEPPPVSDKVSRALKKFRL